MYMQQASETALPKTGWIHISYKWINPTYPIYNWGYNPLWWFEIWMICIQKWFTLWWTYKKLLKMAIEIVDFPIKNGDVPLLC